MLELGDSKIVQGRCCMSNDVDRARKPCALSSIQSADFPPVLMDSEGTVVDESCNVHTSLPRRFQSDVLLLPKGLLPRILPTTNRLRSFEALERI